MQNNILVRGQEKNKRCGQAHYYSDELRCCWAFSNVTNIFRNKLHMLKKWRWNFVALCRTNRHCFGTVFILYSCVTL